MPCRIRSTSRLSRLRMDAWKLRWIASGASLTRGLWPQRCVAGTAGSTSRAGTRGRRGRPPAALSQDRCVARCGPGSRAVAPWWLPSVGHVPVAGGDWASRRCARRGLFPVGALRGCRRAGGRRRPRYASCHRHLPRLHAPEPRTGAPVLASVRRASGETRTARSNVAAPVGAGG